MLPKPAFDRGDLPSPLMAIVFLRTLCIDLSICPSVCQSQIVSTYQLLTGSSHLHETGNKYKASTDDVKRTGTVTPHILHSPSMFLF